MTTELKTVTLPKGLVFVAIEVYLSAIAGGLENLQAGMEEIIELIEFDKQMKCAYLHMCEDSQVSFQRFRMSGVLPSLWMEKINLSIPKNTIKKLNSIKGSLSCIRALYAARNLHKFLLDVNVSERQEPFATQLTYLEKDLFDYIPNKCKRLITLMKCGSYDGLLKKIETDLMYEYGISAFVQENKTRFTMLKEQLVKLNGFISSMGHQELDPKLLDTEIGTVALLDYSDLKSLVENIASSHFRISQK